ncbi:MAG: translational GTPase TypA, partial [Clostridiales bacterium]|nr:translational GTPase TypA [Clostridiales bacterium]
MKQSNLRNIAIIAHVDHGKTTLVDAMLQQSGVYRENQEVVERVMDSGDLERERGITILAKNTAVTYGDVKINIVDTPGHADFGGEVERILKMVNGVILLVDAAEGPMPQTRFVLSHALELGHRVIVVVNKIDRPDQRIHEVIDETLELLMDLDATDEQLDSPFLFCSARAGTCSADPDVPGKDLKPLFDTILDYIPAPEVELGEPFQMLVSSIDYNEFVGRIAIGRVERGTLHQNQEIQVCNYHDPDAVSKKFKASALFEFIGLSRVTSAKSAAGNIVAHACIGDVTIGDTICTPDCIEPLEFVKVSAPTMEMTFSVNDSPYAGRDGKFVTSRQIRDRLYRETLKDVSLRVSDVEDATDSFNVAGRGEMHLAILIETMRREGYEFQVSPPRVLYRTIDGKKCEPMERLVVDVPADYVGSVIEQLGKRKGEMLDMTPVGERMKLNFLVPSRGLFGYRNEFLTATKGEGIMASVFDSYAPYQGDLERRNTGSLISYETGTSITYGLFNAQQRGNLFIGAGVDVYEGMIIGVNPKNEEITVNVSKKKPLTNTRASGSDDAMRLIPP